MGKGGPWSRAAQRERSAGPLLANKTKPALRDEPNAEPRHPMPTLIRPQKDSGSGGQNTLNRNSNFLCFPFATPVLRGNGLFPLDINPYSNSLCYLRLLRGLKKEKEGGEEEKEKQQKRHKEEEGKEDGKEWGREKGAEPIGSREEAMTPC